MRRKAENAKYTSKPFDIKKDIKPEWLAQFGAISVAWNDIEAAIDVGFCMAIFLDRTFWSEVQSRINGLDGKFALIKTGYRAYPVLPDEIIQLMDDTIAAVSGHKGHRDSLTHVRLIDPSADVAPANQSRGTQYQVLITQEALDRLYDHLRALQVEMGLILQILHQRFQIRTWMEEASGPEAVTSDPRIEPAAAIVRECAAQLREHQKSRRELPPLPQFPEQPSGLRGSEAADKGQG